MKRYLSTRQASQILDIGETWTRRLADQGILRISAIGGQGERLFELADVEELAAARAARDSN